MSEQFLEPDLHLQLKDGDILVFKVDYPSDDVANQVRDSIAHVFDYANLPAPKVGFVVMGINEGVEVLTSDDLKRLGLTRTTAANEVTLKSHGCSALVRCKQIAEKLGQAGDDKAYIQELNRLLELLVAQK
jgi:hypothetical protein